MLYDVKIKWHRRVTERKVGVESMYQWIWGKKEKKERSDLGKGRRHQVPNIQGDYRLTLIAVISLSLSLLLSVCVTPCVSGCQLVCLCVCLSVCLSFASLFVVWMSLHRLTCRLGAYSWQFWHYPNQIFFAVRAVLLLTVGMYSSLLQVCIPVHCRCVVLFTAGMCSCSLQVCMFTTGVHSCLLQVCVPVHYRCVFLFTTGV